ncbi:plasmid pRiA4b ORF-3 family protein [bacterium]|nr:plasmid pRiA4b ORF-3 family protein [bacterium]
MKYNIRVILEANEDVIRNIEINSDCLLSELHYYLIECFDLNKNELASFYTTNNELEIIDEIPLVSFEERCSNMQKTKLEVVLDEHNNNLIYVYDYMKMWRFLIELNSIEENFDFKKCINKIGEMPKEAPEINFAEENQNEDEDGIEDEYY